MGKTAIFIFTIINRILKQEIKGELSCLVLCHTRELAYQISKEFARFSKDLNIKTCLLIGGDNEKTQIDDLKNKPVVVIGTPGRILSLSKKNHLNLNNIQVFVIDECDKMLNALGKYISFFILKYYKNRYESRCSKDFQENSMQQTSYDVHCNFA